MATAAQVKALIKSHADGDQERFYAVAMQMAAQAARNGHGRFAQELRDLVDTAKAKSGTSRQSPPTGPVPVVVPRGELAGLLTVGYPKTRFADMALDKSVRPRMDRVILEQRQRTRIEEHGFSPLRKLLLLGPPGTGKTMTAAALAGELSLPLFTIQLDGLITKYLGETAAKLRLIFEAIYQTRAVYLFDEFDALGAERGTKNDVGEIRRSLNSFLQFLELDQSRSIIVAATNHPSLLDRALFRRFDAVITYTLPSASAIEKVMRNRLAPLDSSRILWAKVVSAGKGLSHGDITRACEEAAKKTILSHRTQMETADLLGALSERRVIHDQS